MNPRKQSAPAEDFQPVIDRLKAIDAQSGDALITEGPVHPDRVLLDIVAEALDLVRASTAGFDKVHGMLNGNFGRWTDEIRAEAHVISAEANRLRKASLPLLRRAGKIKATTAAGIYAKASLVRAARTETPGLAASLADDLLALPALRRSLWPAEVSEAEA